ncbi:hypothetical protein JYQ62_01870 [Nostoc sp. UHCC 0702]|nr:hypothetical protein JYQ62_01870 [Nostoc sp. UHCC 0702]
MIAKYRFYCSYQLIIEKSTTDPGYQKGDSFQVTKRVGITTQAGLLNQQFPFETGLENQEFSFMVSVLEHQVHYDGDQKFFDIITESPDRTEI